MQHGFVRSFAFVLALTAVRCASSVNNGGDGGVCTGTRAQVDTAAYQTSPACPDTYDAALASPPSCGGPPYERIFVGECDGTRLIQAHCSLHGVYCAYDGATGAFVGEAAYDDNPEYCDRTSSCIQYGSLGTSKCRADGFMATCQLAPIDSGDGGVSDAGSTDAGMADAGSTDAGPADVQPFDAGPYACGSMTCASNQVCVHPCSGVDAGNGGPQPYCVNVPDTCGESTCDCVRPNACPSTDAGFSFPSCRQNTPGSRDLYCQGCA